ncbi:nucleoside hydrolase [Granulosicoccus sp. 3-233]|uniref:nucleoside hydrolase n=1 Tax=Granulosicoccus sp. 3-233 TaxID=3417969 RepID=UPI003D358731
MRRLIIDTDTASDDAVAIMMAVAADDVQVEALTIVAGNVTLAQGSRNARYTLQLCQADVPVHEGCDRPLQREPSTAEWFHGQDGMSDQNYPAPHAQPLQGHAVTALLERFGAAPGEIDLVTLGPLTNIATALAINPQLAQWVRHCYVMGGAAATLGNVTPAAEYNFWCDPEAARRVMHSGMNLTLVGWELSCGDATLDDQEIQDILALDNDRARLAIDSNRTALQAVRSLQGQTGLALADPVAMAVALYPEIVTKAESLYVDIETHGEMTRGMSVVDVNKVMGKAANATVCFAIDNARWKQELLRALR